MPDSNEDLSQAWKDLQKSVDLDPNNKKAIHDLAVVRALQASDTVGGFGKDYEDKAKQYGIEEGKFDNSLRNSLWGLQLILIAFSAAIIFLVVYKFIQLEPLSLLPWVVLGGLTLSPWAWRISYIRDEKRRNEILKHSYERKAYLEARWVVLPLEKQSDLETRIIEHWMEKSPEETLLALSRKGDSGSSPLTPAALAAIVAAVRRGDP